MTKLGFDNRTNQYTSFPYSIPVNPPVARGRLPRNRPISRRAYIFYFLSVYIEFDRSCC